MSVKNTIVKLFVTQLLMLLFVINPVAQVRPTPTPSPTPENVLATVEVSTEFVDRANQAFKLVVEQRDALAKFRNERVKTEAQQKAANTLIAGLDKLVEIHVSTIEAAEKLIKMQESFIQTQQKFIDALIELTKEKKKRGFLGKLWDGFKLVALMVLSLYAGKGL